VPELHPFQAKHGVSLSGGAEASGPTTGWDVQGENTDTMKPRFT